MARGTGDGQFWSNISATFCPCIRRTNGCVGILSVFPWRSTPSISCRSAASSRASSRACRSSVHVRTVRHTPPSERVCTR